MLLTNDKIIEELDDLIRFDLDAVGAYKTAIDDIEETFICDQLSVFRSDHERHVTELSSLVRGLGGDPPKVPGVRGVIRKTMTKVAGLAGTRASLMAMKSNEEVLNKEYLRRLTLELPESIKEVVRRNYGDEQRHLAWVEQALASRIWEREQPSV